MVNVLNCHIGTATLDGTLAGAITTAVAGAYNTNLIPEMSSAVNLDKIVVTDLRVANGPQFTTQVNQAGALSDNILPTQVAAVVRWITDTRGKSHRGRTYLGGFTEAGSAGQSPTGGVTSAIVAWTTSILADLTSASAPLTVVSRYEKNPSPPPVTIPRVTNIDTLVTDSYVDAAWHTRRSRALKG